MGNKQYFKSKIFSIDSEQAFEELALELFKFQSIHNPVYARYLSLLDVDEKVVRHIGQIPFLPIGFFKTQKVMTGRFVPQTVFTSSGTTGQLTSRHFIDDLQFYDRCCQFGFEREFGPLADFCVLALLPSYLERSGSSLIRMADRMIAHSGDAHSSFYLNEFEKLNDVILRKISRNKKTLLLGVSFALLDFADKFTLPANGLIVMETGGMKGRRKEIIREELHSGLTKALGVKAIHSEYGMTELMSQAYSQADGRFKAPPWMRVFIRQVDDPFSVAQVGKTGGINVIDLANVDSCAFIETQDLGRLHADASFEVMGRFDNSDIRGCNLMVI